MEEFWEIKMNKKIYIYIKNNKKFESCLLQSVLIVYGNIIKIELYLWE